MSSSQTSDLYVFYPFPTVNIIVYLLCRFFPLITPIETVDVSAPGLYIISGQGDVILFINNLVSFSSQSDLNND